MRRGHDNGWIENDGLFMGVCLGADFTAEHEWGIDKLRCVFGIPSAAEVKAKRMIGEKARKVTTVPESLFFHKDKDCAWLIAFNIVTWKLRNKETSKLLENYAGELRDNPLGTAWDEGSFGVRSSDVKKVEALRDAFHRRDIILTFRSSLPVFENPGLCLVISSTVPAQFIKQMEDGDRDGFALQDAAKKTGIHDVLEKAGRRYYALSPRWKDKPDGDVVFWLNPMDQHIHNHGWYPVADLQAWANGTGPVMKALGKRS